MTKADFVKWLSDFTKRFPDVGTWLSSKPQTLEIWFDDCFASLELTDCVAVNMQLMASGQLNESWNRDRIPAIYLKRCAEIRHDRLQRVRDRELAREAKARGCVRQRGSYEAEMRSMRACVREVCKLPKYMRRRFIDQYFDDEHPVLTAEAWVDDPSVLLTPARDTLFATVPSESDGGGSFS